MTTFLNDFTLFYNTIFELMINFWNWFSGTILGEIIIFTVIISLFVGVIYLIVHMKD